MHITGFDEDNQDAINYQDSGATFVAMQAGLLSIAEVRKALHDMRQNVRTVNAMPPGAGNTTIGLTCFPPHTRQRCSHHIRATLSAIGAGLVLGLFSNWTGAILNAQ